MLPKMIREALPEVTIGFFGHIPFPSYEIFRMLPWRKELLEGMLGADVAGSHTYDDVRHFVAGSLRHVLPVLLGAARRALPGASGRGRLPAQRRQAVGHQRHGRHAAAGGRVLHRSPLPRRPAPPRRRCHRRAGQRLQPGEQLHLVDPVLHRPRRPRDGDDPVRSTPGGRLTAVPRTQQFLDRAGLRKRAASAGPAPAGGCQPQAHDRGAFQ